MGPDFGDRRALSAFREIAFAKLNLALHVRGKMPDGRHRIETVFVFCEDGDLVEAEEAGDLSLSVHGPFAHEIPFADDNLVLKAARELQTLWETGAGASIRLTKTLPVASGVGGGSADAAAALRLLTRMWGTDPALAARIAPRLGADVPACLISRPSRGEGAGDEIEPVDVAELSGQPVLLVNPGIPLSTGAVFGKWDGSYRGPLTDWRHGRNDLQVPARALVPEIGEVLGWLGSRPGTEFARMSGSGATCFALFESAQARDSAAAAVPAGWWHMATRLR